MSSLFTGFTFKDKMLILFSVICFFLLFVGGPDYYSPRSFKYGWGLGHIITFSLWSYLFFKLRFFEMKKISLRGFSTIVFFSALIGITIEFFQSLIGRESSISDVIRDVEGTLLTLLFFSPISIDISKTVKIVLQIGIVCTILFETKPFAVAAIDEITAKKQFPVLSSFETPFEASRWGRNNFKRTSKFSKDGEYALEVPLLPGKYSGVSLNYFPENWSGYDFFLFSIMNPSPDAVWLTCRISDIDHHLKTEEIYEDRFNQRFKVNPGWNNFSISRYNILTAPTGRDMDLSKIKQVGFFATDVKEKAFVYIDNVKLSNSI